MRRPWARWAAAAASGLLLAAAFPPLGLWGLAWVALVPLMRAVRAAPDASAAADLGGLCGFSFAACSLPWLTKSFGGWAAALWCVFALGPGLHAFLMKRLEGRWGEGDAGALAEALAAGLLWAGVEAARAHLPRLACPWLTLGFSQSACLPLLQGAAVFGVYGLSAAVAAANAALVLALERRRVPAEVLIGLFGTAWAAGEARLAVEPAGAPARVAVVQDEGYDLERLARLTRSPEASGAALVVWPEYQLSVAKGREEAYRRLFASRVAGSGAVLVAGAVILPDGPKGRLENFAWVLGPDGRLLGRYDKAHPIPLMERALAGHADPRPVPTPLGPVGVQICYDLDFEDGARLLARRGARVLAVPDLDPAEWGPVQHAQHAGMAPLRAVESGLWVAKAASSGESQVIDPRGRVRARVGFGVSGAAAAEVRLAPGGTPYTRWGWLVVPGSLLAVLAALLDAAQEAFRRRARAAYPPGSLPEREPAPV